MAFPPSPQKRLFVTIVAACTVVTLTIGPGQLRAENAHDLNLETSIGTNGVGRARPAKPDTSKSVMVPQRGSTGGARRENGTASVQVDDRLEVRTTNTLAGGVEAVDGSQAAVGDVSLTGVKADALTIETKSNVAGKVEAQGGSTFRAGTVHLEKLRGKSARITSTNTLDGSVTIKKGSTVSVGNTNVGNEARQDEYVQNRESLTDSARPSGLLSSPQGIGLFDKNDPNGQSAGPTMTFNEQEKDQCSITDGSGKPLPDCSELCKKGNICSEDCAVKAGCNIVDGCSNVPDELNSLGMSALFGQREKCCGPPKNLPCNNHDRCYQRKNMKYLGIPHKNGCDIDLGIEMSSACTESFKNSKNKILSISDLTTCYEMAALYTAGVEALAWKPFYQRQHLFD